MNDLYEFLFCPIHGVFGAANWPLTVSLLTGGGVALRQCWHAIRARFK